MNLVTKCFCSLRVANWYLRISPFVETCWSMKMKRKVAILCCSVESVSLGDKTLMVNLYYTSLFFDSGNQRLISELREKSMESAADQVSPLSWFWNNLFIYVTVLKTIWE